MLKVILLLFVMFIGCAAIDFIIGVERKEDKKGKNKK